MREDRERKKERDDCRNEGRNKIKHNPEVKKKQK
jgi:hypothetical protein